jgi:succinate dehydrogenase / fumarate reductase flavoprotein subunit
MIPFLRSTLAAKLGMAVTGLLLTGFVIGHLSGNFLIFAGQDAINDYAEFLKKNVGLLWSARIGLLVVFAVHILLAIRVRNGNRSARPTRYAYEDTVQASAASRTMILSGLVILAYVDPLEMGPAPLRHEAGQPGQQAQVHVIVVGTGLAGASAAATLAELGYNVKASASRTARAARTASPPRAASTPRRTTRTTATASTGCSTTRSRAATSAAARPTSTGWPSCRSTSSTSASRRACPSRASTAACWPTARSAARRSAAPSTRAARPGSSCCSAPTQALRRQIGAGKVKMHTRPRCSTSSWSTAGARGIVPRPRHRQDRAPRRRRGGARTGGYGNVFYLSTNAMGCNVTAAWRAYKRGALFANPCYTQIHPTCIPVQSGDYQSKLTLMSESLRNDGRIWVPKKGRHRAPPTTSPRTSATTTSSEATRASATSPRATSRRGRPRRSCDEGRGVGLEERRLPRLRRRHRALGENVIATATATCSTCTSASRARPVQGADAHLPRGPLHDGRAVGRLQPQSNDPRPVRARRGQLLRPRRQPPRRSALMQGLADGYFVIPYTIGNYLAGQAETVDDQDTPRPPSRQVRGRPPDEEARLAIRGNRPDSFHRELGKHHVGRLRHGAHREGLSRRIERSRRCARSSGRTSACPEIRRDLNQALEKAGRVADFLELGELMCHDALTREESCGGHFREEHQTRTARRSATTRTSATSPPGNSRATGNRPASTRSS